jgi:hypothetical protein
MTSPERKLRSVAEVVSWVILSAKPTSSALVDAGVKGITAIDIRGGPARAAVVFGWINTNQMATPAITTAAAPAANQLQRDPRVMRNNIPAEPTTRGSWAVATGAPSRMRYTSTGRAMFLTQHLVADVLAYADLARFRQRLQSRRNVDAVAVDVLTVEDDVTDVDADPKLDAPLGWYSRVALCHASFYVDRAANRFDYAGKLEQ